MVTRLALAAALLALPAAGCDYLTDSFTTNDFSGDPFPVYVDTTSGAIHVGMQLDGEQPRDAVLDVLSPLSIVDRGASAAPAITYPGLTLLGERAPGGPLDQPRAHFVAPQVVTLHPCTTATCAVGPTGQQPFTGLIGMSAFASDALRLDLGAAAPQMFVLPDIAGDETHRTLACDAVLPSPFRGGGDLVIGGTEDVHFTNWRIAIDTCLAPEPSPALPQASRGTDVLLVASTGIGITLIDESAYARYQQQVGVSQAPDLTSLRDDSVVIASGVVHGKHAAHPLSGMALVGNAPATPRAPCRQVYASHLLETSNVPSTVTDCPCGLDPVTNTCSPTFCAVPAIVELAPSAGIDFLIVPDDDPTIQSLRAELRPDRPEVDGILGADALAQSDVELDIDYPHDRVLGRCHDQTTCSARPELIDQCERGRIQNCFGKPRIPCP